MAVTLKRFAFDLDFGADAELPPPPPAEQPAEDVAVEDAPPPPTFSEEELAAARQAAYAEGRETGREEARRASEERLILALEGLGRGLQDLSRDLQTSRQASEAAGAGTAFLLVRRLFPLLAQRFGAAEMEALLGESLRGLRSEPRVVVRVADEQLDILRDRLDRLSERAGFDGRIVLIADEELGAGDIRVEWADGGAERSAGHLWQAAEEHFMAAFDIAPDTAARKSGSTTAETARTSGQALHSRPDGDGDGGDDGGNDDGAR